MIMLAVIPLVLKGIRIEERMQTDECGDAYRATSEPRGNSSRSSTRKLGAIGFARGLAVRFAIAPADCTHRMDSRACSA